MATDWVDLVEQAHRDHDTHLLDWTPSLIAEIRSLRARIVELTAERDTARQERETLECELAEANLTSNQNFAAVQQLRADLAAARRDGAALRDYECPVCGVKASEAADVAASCEEAAEHAEANPSDLIPTYEKLAETFRKRAAALRGSETP